MTDDADIRPRRKKRLAKRKKSVDPAALYFRWTIIGSVAGLALFVVWCIVPVAGGGWLIKGTALDPQVRAKVAAERARQKAEEEALQQQIASYANMAGKGQHVVVEFENISSPNDELTEYLRRRVLRTARIDFNVEMQRAGQVTHANRERARSVKEAELQAKEAEYARQQRPQFARPNNDRFFEYQVERNRLGEPFVKLMGTPKGRIVFVVLYLADIQRFASQLRFPDNKITDRTITIRAPLSSPPPDPDVEELEEEYGQGTCVTVHIAGLEPTELGPLAEKIYAAVIDVNILGRSATWGQDYYTITKTDGTVASKRFSTVNVKFISKGTYRIYFAPISDLEQLVKTLPFETVEKVDPQARTIIIQAKADSESN